MSPIKLVVIFAIEARASDTPGRRHEGGAEALPPRPPVLPQRPSPAVDVRGVCSERPYAESRPGTPVALVRWRAAPAMTGRSCGRATPADSSSGPSGRRGSSPRAEGEFASHHHLPTAPTCGRPPRLLIARDAHLVLVTEVDDPLPETGSVGPVRLDWACVASRSSNRDQAARPLDRRMRRASRPAAEAVGMEVRTEDRGEHLRDGLAIKPSTAAGARPASDPAAVRPGNLHRPDWGRNVGPRAHPVPVLVEVVHKPSTRRR
jgi:hypothetical protein